MASSNGGAQQQQQWPSPDAGKFLVEKRRGSNSAATGPNSVDVRNTEMQKLSSKTTMPELHSTNQSGRQQSDRQKAVTITLHTRKDDLDERAQVKVSVRNPEVVVEKMLNTLAHKFPPESVVTIAAAAANPNFSDEASTSVDSSSQSVSSRSRTKGLSTGASPYRLSGRHYLGLKGQYYPEICDSDGCPVYGHACDPMTGIVLPVGCEVIGTDGRPRSDVILAPNGKHIPGLPVPPEGLDENMRPLLWYKTASGNAISESPPGMCRRRSSAASQINHVKEPLYSNGGQHSYRGAGRRHSRTSTEHQTQAAGGGGHQQHSPYPQADSALYPESGFGLHLQQQQQITNRTQALDCASAEAKRRWLGGSSGRLRSEFAKNPKEVKNSALGLSYYDVDSQQAVSVLTSFGPNEGNNAGIFSSTQFPRYQGQRDEMINDLGVAVKIPAPCYALLDGSYAQLAVGQDGRPMDGYGMDPRTGSILPVGRPVFDVKGNLAEGMILDPKEGRVSGLQLAFHGWDANNQQPTPFYLGVDNQWAPMYVDHETRPIHGLARDPKTNQVKPVGLQAFDECGRAIPGTIIGPDGRTALGIPLSINEDDNAAAAAAAASAPLRQLSLFRPTNSNATVITNYIQGGAPLQQGRYQSALSGNYAPVSHQPSIPERSIMNSANGPYISRAQTSMSQGSGVSGHTGATLLTPGRADEVDEDGMTVRYVAVPVVEEKIIHVPKREVREIERKVPKVEVIEVVKTVEVPQIHYIDRHVEVPRIETISKEVKVKQVVDRPYEVLVHKPKIEIKIVEQIKEVPGDIVEVPRIQRVEQPVYVPRYWDKEVPTVVAQKLQPLIRQVSEVRRVPCSVTQPKVITVDIFIPKPVISCLGAGRKTKESHRTVDIPAAQFNALTRRLNVALDASHIEPLYIKDGYDIPILPVGERVETVEPVSQDWASSHQPGKVHCSNSANLPQLQIQETLGVGQRSRGARYVKNAEEEVGEGYSSDSDVYSFSEAQPDELSSVDQRHCGKRQHRTRDHHHSHRQRRCSDDASSDRQYDQQRHHRHNHHRHNHPDNKNHHNHADRHDHHIRRARHRHSNGRSRSPQRKA